MLSSNLYSAHGMNFYLTMQHMQARIQGGRAPGVRKREEKKRRRKKRKERKEGKGKKKRWEHL